MTDDEIPVIVEDYLRCLVDGNVPAHGLGPEESGMVLGSLLGSLLGLVMNEHPSVTADEWVRRVVPDAVQGVFLIESFTEAFPDT